MALPAVPCPACGGHKVRPLTGGSYTALGALVVAVGATCAATVVLALVGVLLAIGGAVLMVVGIRASRIARRKGVRVLRCETCQHAWTVPALIRSRSKAVG